MGICTRYYSSITIGDDHSEDFNYLFRYMQLCIDYIIHEKSLSRENKHLRITEFCCALPESVRVLLFCWLLINSQTTLADYYKYGIFIFDETRAPLLRDIITYVCTKKRPPQRPIPKIDPENIILEDYPKEQFPETYKRLYE